MKKFNELLSNIKTVEESIKIDEVLSASDPTSKWISDFVHSDNPKFEGKSKKQRIQMALGAAYAAKRASKNEELDLEIVDSIAEELDLEIIEQKSDLEYAEDARIEALKLKEDNNLDGFHMLMAIHHCHLSEHFAENQKTNLAEKHDLLAMEHLSELGDDYSSELIENLLTDAVASATADYGVAIKMLPAGPAKNKTWAHQKGRAARGTTYDAAVDKEVRTSKTKTPATINPKRRKEVEQEINRKAIFGEEIETDLQEAKTIDNPKVHDLRHLKSSRAVYDATQGGYRDKEGKDREVKDGDVIHTSKGVGILNQAWPVHHSGSEGAFHRLKPGYSMHTIDDGKYKKSVELANSVTKQNLKQTMKHGTGGMVGPKGKLPEEVEQINELSKKTLRSYMAKAVGSKTAHDYGVGVATARGLDDLKKTSLEKSKRRSDGLIRAIVKTTKEEVEQIDELSQEKMASYMKAAKKDIYKNLRGGDPEPGSKRAIRIVNRITGYRRAWEKTARQNEEVVAEAKAWEPKVVFSGTGADGSKYKITHAGPTDFMIHVNDKHIDTYSSLHRAKNVLKNEVPGLKKGVAEGLPGSLSNSDYTSGKTVKHTSSNCTTCHGRKSMYKVGDTLFADNKPGATKVKCPTCKGTGDKQGVAEAINPDNPRDYNIPTYLRKRKGQAPLTTKDIKDRDTESPTTPEGLAKKAKKLGIDEGMTPAVSASIGGSMGSSGRAYAKAKLLAAKARGIKEEVERVDEVSAKWVRQNVPYYPDRAIDAVHIAQRPYRGKYDTDAEAKEADRIIRVRTKGYERYAKKNSKENPPPKVTPSDNPGYYSNRPKSGFGSGREDDTYGT